MSIGNSPCIRTKVSDPLIIYAVQTPGGGWIGMTICPGKQQAGVVSGNGFRNLAVDLSVISDWGATAVLTLMEQRELARYHVPDIGASVQKLGLEWYHMPIPDEDVPGAAFESL